MIIDNDTFFADVLQMLDEGKRVTIPVKGYSMLPFIRGGKDLVVLESGRYVMHRILSIDGDAVDIMGDGVPKTHEHVRRNQICAKAVEILRGGKRAVDPYSPGQLRLVHFWQRLRPVRRYILFVYRHLPWNRSWIKENSKGPFADRTSSPARERPKSTSPSW